MKKAIVTGASSGIGRRTAQQLAENGYAVLAVARRSERLEQLKSQVAQTAGANGGKIIPCPIDLAQGGAAEKVIREAEKQLGGLDLLVNNAGTSWVGPLETMPQEKLDDILNLNIKALILLCQGAIALLEKSTSAQIINIGSVAAHLPMETIAGYCASKAAVVMFSRVLAKELAPKNIRVNVLSPAGTDTQMFDNVGVTVDQSQLISAQDMARLVVMLTQLPPGADVPEMITSKRLAPWW